jgi:hypothetical protein
MEPSTERVVIDQEASFWAFLIQFRKRIGRPMSEAEHSLAHVAYASGFTDGVDWAYADVEAHADEWVKP